MKHEPTHSMRHRYQAYTHRKTIFQKVTKKGPQEVFVVLDTAGKYHVIVEVHYPKFHVDWPSRDSDGVICYNNQDKIPTYLKDYVKTAFDYLDMHNNGELKSSLDCAISNLFEQYGAEGILKSLRKRLLEESAIAQGESRSDDARKWVMLAVELPLEEKAS